MTNEVATIATAPQPFPPGTVSGGIVVSVSGPVTLPSQTLTSAPYTAVFAGLTAGSYTFTAQAIDHTGAALGIPVTDIFVIEPDVSIDVPQSITFAAA